MHCYRKVCMYIKIPLPLYWQLGPKAKLSLKDVEYPWRYCGAYGHHSGQADGGQEAFSTGNTPYFLLILTQEQGCGGRTTLAMHKCWFAEDRPSFWVSNPSFCFVSHIRVGS